MPRIDVTSILSDSMIAGESFIIKRRKDAPDQYGETQISFIRYRAIGCIYADPGARLEREAEAQFMYDDLTVVTTFRLQGPSDGYQPDVIIWNNDEYIVKELQDFSNYGAGFVVAKCSSIASIDAPTGSVTDDNFG